MTVNNPRSAVHDRKDDFKAYEKLPAKVRELLNFEAPDGMSCEWALRQISRNHYDEDEAASWLETEIRDLTYANLIRNYGTTHPQAQALKQFYTDD
jgi:hypothetical protein